MLKHRIIPILLWDGDQVVQSVKFCRPHRKCGSMREHIRVMEKRNVDELIILDVNATIEGREPKFDLIKKYAGELFCPVTYGGGISKIEHVEKLIMECGVDKIAINACTFKQPEIIRDLASKFGSQSIVYSIDVSRKWSLNGLWYHTRTPNDKPFMTSSLMLDVVKTFRPGEVLITSIDHNGTREGYELDTLNLAGKLGGIPIIINGGCGSPEHMKQALEAGASAVAASSMFLFTEHTPRSVARELAREGLAVRTDG